MDSWDNQTSSPVMKFDNSPAESLLSAPGDMYPSLFESSATPGTTTMNPLDIMTPRSFCEENGDVSVLAGLSDAPTESTPSSTPTQSSEKKTTKKRKSWGQVLPEPKTNLPPRYTAFYHISRHPPDLTTDFATRKRAKTEDEKEQRRVERVLRNRRAAQSSRERKRLEVEALEQRNKELEASLLHAQKANFMLVEELNKLRRNSGVVTRSPSSLDSLRPTPVTFSQELFSSQDGHRTILEQTNSSIVAELLMSAQSSTTVNPASLSPELNPVADEDDDLEAEEEEEATAATPAPEAAAATMTASPDVTQHPAEMLCDGLQCQSAEAARWWPAASQRPLAPALALFLQLHLLLASTSAILSVCQRPLTQIAMSLKAGFSLPPTPSILNTIIWLVTTPQHSPSRPRTLSRTRISTHSTLTSSSTTSPPILSSRSYSTNHSAAAASPPTRHLSSTLRLKSLRKILTCSPILARPLTDATMAVLRLVSSEGRDVDRVSGGGNMSVTMAAAAAGGQQQPRQPCVGRSTASCSWPWPNGTSLPSKEVLLTLLWALRVEERRLQIRERAETVSRPGLAPSVLKIKTPATAKIMNQSIVLEVVPTPKRGREEVGPGLAFGKRRRYI